MPCASLKGIKLRGDDSSRYSLFIEKITVILKMIKHLEKRFTELAEQISKVESSKQRVHDAYSGQRDQIDAEMFLSWCVKTRNLLSNACGIDSQHFLAFEKAEKPIGYSSNYDVMKRVKAVFFAAKEDFEGGYLTSVKNLVQAEVFDSELEQASELMSAGYVSAAAVVAGVVLETTLQNLCGENKIPLGKLEKMNADLVKIGAYNSLTQKRITALAAIRNSAAHGKVGEFSKADVESMISEVEKFVSNVLS